ncbi:HAMP domain-containing sensor histidine kinase [Thioalkalicoccus limnaeus]|uniref:histidine kinase n=1 Tax=Thioalkalicoccus limnaeus TaxID=120681 RepID=A0ABV4BAR5_9GAMM
MMTRALASLRLRLPLSLSVSAILTAIGMAAALGLQTLANLREDQGRNALTLAHAMADVQVQALRNDDVWLAYSLLRGPEGGAGDAVWILVDDAGRIFASNDPRRFRLDQPLAEAAPWLADRPAVPLDDPIGGVFPVNQGEARRILRLPLYSDGTQTGELIALLSDAPYLPRFREILIGGVIVTLGVLVVLVPIGWLWGRRMVAPLARLTDCMARVGKEDPRQMNCRLEFGDGEIGRLGRQFLAMIAALAEKEALERQMIQAERLAAVGRVAAGVAHEVNNPLGGMLLAIDTYRRSQPVDVPTRRLLDLLERALNQIQESISALLIEARADTRRLTPQDLDDVRTLAQPKLASVGARLAWHNDWQAATTLPAAPVRQLLLNLVLNALQAAGQAGRVVVHVAAHADRLSMRVENTGRPIPPERLTHLFEPYSAARSDHPGIGLWVCYQLASQLGGSIGVESHEGVTGFTVSLPLDAPRVL